MPIMGSMFGSAPDSSVSLYSVVNPSTGTCMSSDQVGHWEGFVEMLSVAITRPNGWQNCRVEGASGAPQPHDALDHMDPTLLNHPTCIIPQVVL